MNIYYWEFAFTLRAKENAPGNRTTHSLPNIIQFLIYTASVLCEERKKEQNRVESIRYMHFLYKLYIVAAKWLYIKMCPLSTKSLDNFGE